MYRAIKVIPENAQVIRTELDLVVLDMFTEKTPRYIVDGFAMEPVSWKMVDETQFRKNWRFLMDREAVGRFTTVIVNFHCVCGHRMTQHYYGGDGITEHCIVPDCPCIKAEEEINDE